MVEKSRVEKLIIKNSINTCDMKNDKLKLQFIEEMYSNASDRSIIPIIRKFNQYGRIETEFEKDLMEFSMQDFIKFFEMFPWSYGSFMSNKSLIKMYLDWARDKNLISNFVCRTLESIDYSKPSHRKMYEKYYFKNFQELQDTIEFYREKCKRESSTLKYGLCEVAIHLAWSGIKMVDLIEIKLQDVDFKEKKIYISRLDRYISIDSMIFNNLIVFLDIKEYNAEDYVKPDYLIRTGKMTKLNLSYLSALISRMIGDNTTFNEGIDNTDKKIISYQRVFLSGIYYRARLDEINNGEISRKDLDRLNKLFQESYTKIDAKISIDISKRMIDYNDYLKYMYREEYYRTKS